jgi:tRNA 2-thiouridine synthesizing protein A
MPEQRVIDGRGLVPPEPLELAVAALGEMASGDELVMLLQCEPHPLYSLLDRKAYRYSSRLRDDGTNEIHIHKL